MIVIEPPATVPYAPATQPIAFVDVLVQRDELTNRLNLVFACLDAKKNRISIDQNGIPQPAVTPAQLEAFVAAKAQAGDTLDQDLSRRALPIVAKNLGLTGKVV
jgi:hypothetical protein